MLQGIPNVYEGDIEAEEEVLDWLIEMKVESHIELITRPMLEVMVEEVQYLAVYFCKLYKFNENRIKFTILIKLQSSKIAELAIKF